MFYVVFFLNVHIVFMAYSLDYPGVGPEHSYLKDIGRAEYYSVTDDEALEGMASTNFFTFSVVFLGFSPHARVRARGVVGRWRGSAGNFLFYFISEGGSIMSYMMMSIALH